MSRLPPALQPLWPAAKRVHRLGAVFLGLLGRLVAPLLGRRGLPRRGLDRSAATAAREPDGVLLHPAGPVEPIRRGLPGGDPPGHWTFTDADRVDVRDRYVLEVRDGTVVGDYGAVVTAGGTLDYETSEYFGIDGWREHPIFLRGVLPRAQRVSGTLAVLATRGSSANYYHFLLDALPRWAILGEAMPGVVPDALYVPNARRYERELLALTGLDRLPIIPTTKHGSVRADRLLVPSLPNPFEVAPRWVVDWVRTQLPAQRTEDKPRRIYVSRGTRRNTRRLDCEPELLPELERRGFTSIDPGAMSVRDQIDHFAAADVVVAPHGAGLTNLVFSPPGVSVLHLFAPGYVKHCFWAILDGIPGARYRYLIGAGTPAPPGTRMQAIQQDVDLPAERILAELDALLDR